MKVVEVNNISKYFWHTAALRSISFSLFEGETVAVLGPNGAGKSTLLSCLAGLLRPEYGSITFSNEKIRIGAVFSKPFLYGSLTLKENLELFACLEDPEGGNARAKEVLSLMGLERAAKKNLRICSKGESRRAAIARALLVNPKLLILDEPFSGLDDTSRERLTKVLQSLRKEGTTIIFASHDIHAVRVLADRPLILMNGMLSNEVDANTPRRSQGAV